MIIWVLCLGAGLVVGVLAGLYFARLDDFSNSQKKLLQQKLDLAEKQLNDYKTQVGDHFLKTAALVNSMTESYKAVHAHLAAGAKELCDSPITEMQLEMPANKLLETVVQETPQKSHIPVPTEDSEKPQSAPLASDAVTSDAKSETNADLLQSESVQPSTSPAKSVQEQGEAPQATMEPPATPESLHVLEHDTESPDSLQESEHKVSNPAANNISEDVTKTTGRIVH